ncbi:MAG: hypothetical protein ABSB63_03275 [Spirochaetia bacterium]|jgi:hypothetical protein
MRKWSRLVAVMALVACAILGCTTYPAQVQLDPARFENKTLRVEWAIGSTFFRLKISNLTDASFDLDLANSAVVSVDGEARYLLAAGRKDVVVIPPRSYIVVASEQGAVFGTDIFGRFNAESEEKYPLPGGGFRAEDRTFLKSHSGETLRLYLLADVEGKKAVFDIPFKITGAARVLQSGSEDKGAAPAAAPAPPPVVSPAPPAKK